MSLDEVWNLFNIVKNSFYGEFAMCFIQTKIKEMKTNLSAYLLVFGGLLMIAQEEQKEHHHQEDTLKTEKIHLNDIIVKGDFFTDPTFSIQINNLDQAVQPKNVADLFQDVDGMSFIKRGNYAIDPSFRGAQYEELNVQYDGGVKAMHACPNRMDPVTTHVLPEEVEKIEVIKGPYSVRYGNNFAGVVNLVTQKPGLMKEGLDGDIKMGYETNGGTYLTEGGIKYAGKNFHVKGNAGYRDFGNYKDGNGTEIPSAFKSTDYSLGAGYSPNHNNHLMVHWRQSFGRDVLHAGLPMDTQSDDSSIFSFDYYGNHFKGTIKQVGAKFYYSVVDHIMNNFLRPNFMMMAMESDVNATTYGGKFEANWEPTKKLSLFTGIDVNNVKREGTRTMTRKKDMNGNVIANPKTMRSDIWQDAYVNDYGIFTEGDYEVTEKWVLKAGLRLDFVGAEPKLPAENFTELYGTLDKKNNTNVGGHIGVKFSPKKKQIYEFAFGRGVRSPNMTERYINYFTIGQDSYNYVGNPNLKPEENHQIEVGFNNETKVLNGNGFKFHYGLSGYYSFLRNYISAIVNSNLATMAQPNVKQFVNIKKAFRTGFEGFIDTHITKNWVFGANVAFVYAQNEDWNESLPLLPPLTAKFNLQYRTNKWNANLKFKAVATQHNYAKSFGENSTPGYGLTDFELTYKPIPKLSLGGAILNIFNKAYYNHQNFYFINEAGFDRVPINEPGRNFTFFVRYTL